MPRAIATRVWIEIHKAGLTCPSSSYHMATTIRDVAKQLHLSITTVFHALDGYHDVASRTRQPAVRTTGRMAM